MKPMTLLPSRIGTPSTSVSSGCAAGQPQNRGSVRGYAVLAGRTYGKAVRVDAGDLPELDGLRETVLYLSLIHI